MPLNCPPCATIFPSPSIRKPEGIEETLEKWTPRYSYELIPVETLNQPIHYNPYLIAK